MDTFPVQPASFGQEPIIKSPQKSNLKKALNISSWVIFFALLPLTVLIFLSQDSIPGDFFYPVKRSLENVVLAAASVSPAAKAAFRTDLTEARFKEAQDLIVLRSNASGLTTFIDDVQSTKQEVANLESNIEREKAEEKLTAKIEEYQNGLSVLEAKAEQNLIDYSVRETPTFTPTPTPTSAPALSSTATSAPSSTPVQTILRQSGQASSAPSETSAPTLTLVPTNASITPTISPQQENVQIAEQEKITQIIKETKIRLEKIKKDLEESRNKGRQKEDKKSETETSSNKDSDKKNESRDRQK